MNLIETIICYVAFFTIVTLAICSGAHAGQIGISSGPEGMTYHATATDIKKACPHLDIVVYPSKGGVSNLGAMFTRPEVQYAPVPWDTVKLKEKTEAARIKRIGVIMPLYKNVYQVVASVRSGIKNVTDLKGKRGNSGPLGSGSWVGAQLVKQRIGIDWTETTYPAAESLKKVMNGELDFAFYFSGVPTPDLVNVGKDGEGVIRLVSMKHPELENFYEPTEIPENTYAFEPNTVPALQVANYLVGLINNSPEKMKDAEDLLNCLIAKEDWLIENGNPVWNSVDKNAPVKLQYHPAAERILGGK